MAKGTIRPGDDVRRRPLVGLILFAIVVAIGTLWYSLVEGFSIVNGFYQTVTTILTVGFGEVEPLGSRGRIFTVVLLLLGVGVALYVAVTAVESFVENKLGLLGRRRMEHQIAKLEGHTVLCGYGRVGREIVDMLVDRATVVVVDRDHEALLEAQHDHVFCVSGDATDDAVLVSAGWSGPGTSSSASTPTPTPSRPCSRRANSTRCCASWPGRTPSRASRSCAGPEPTTL